MLCFYHHQLLLELLLISTLWFVLSLLLRFCILYRLSLTEHYFGTNVFIKFAKKVCILQTVNILLSNVWSLNIILSRIINILRCSHIFKIDKLCFRGLSILSTFNTLQKYEYVWNSTRKCIIYEYVMKELYLNANLKNTIQVYGRFFIFNKVIYKPNTYSNTR